jgi:hypothetical protein
VGAKHRRPADDGASDENLAAAIEELERSGCAEARAYQSVLSICHVRPYLIRVSSAQRQAVTRGASARSLPQEQPPAKCASATEIPGRAGALIAGPAFEAGDLHRLGDQSRIPPRLRAYRECRTVKADDRNTAGGGDVKGPAVAADVQDDSIEQRPQLGQGKVAYGQYAVARARRQTGTRCFGNPVGRFGLGGPEVRKNAFAASRRGPRSGKTLLRPAAKRVINAT